MKKSEIPPAVWICRGIGSLSTLDAMKIKPQSCCWYKEGKCIDIGQPCDARRFKLVEVKEEK